MSPKPNQPEKKGFQEYPKVLYHPKFGVDKASGHHTGKVVKDAEAEAKFRAEHGEDVRESPEHFGKPEPVKVIPGQAPPDLSPKVQSLEQELAALKLQLEAALAAQAAPADSAKGRKRKDDSE